MKLSYKLLSQPNMAKLNKVEMDTLLELVKNQNESGRINGVHYRDICAATGIAKQSFYNALYGLKIKDIISFEKDANNGFYNVLVKYNDFSNGHDSFKQGYINLQRKVFHQKAFKKLKAHEKYLVFILLKRTHENRSSFKMIPKNLYDKYCKLFNVTKRVVRSYLHSVRKFFSIGIVKGLYYITYKHSVFKPKLDKPERYYKDRAYINSVTKKLKIRGFTEHELDQVTELMHQYRNMCKESGTSIETVMLNAIYHSSKDKTQHQRNLDYKYINKLINRHLNKGEYIEEYNRPIASIKGNELERILLASN